MIIKCENTAISTGIANSAKCTLKFICETQDVLDYGAGKLRNSKYLRDNGLKVSILDTETQINRLKDEDIKSFVACYSAEDLPINKLFNRILCSFVLNVLPEEEERKEILKNIHKLLKEEGVFFLEVRMSRGILQNKNIEPYNDGYLVGKNTVRTFQKPFTKEEVVNLLESEKFKIIEVKIFNDSIVATCKKQKCS